MPCYNQFNLPMLFNDGTDSPSTGIAGDNYIDTIMVDSSFNIAYGGR